MAPASVFLPTLPGRYYTDPAIFEAEKRNIFERQWQYACRAEDVPVPGRSRTCCGRSWISGSAGTGSGSPATTWPGWWWAGGSTTP